MLRTLSVATGRRCAVPTTAMPDRRRLRQVSLPVSFDAVPSQPKVGSVYLGTRTRGEI